MPFYHDSGDLFRPSLVGREEWEPGYLACALSAIAAAKGHHAVAEAVLEISSREVAETFLEWHFNQ